MANLWAFANVSPRQSFPPYGISYTYMKLTLFYSEFEDRYYGPGHTPQGGNPEYRAEVTCTNIHIQYYFIVVCIINRVLCCYMILPMKILLMK